MSEVESWDELRKAVDSYLRSFDSDVIHMTPSHRDDRFPPGFLETFARIFTADAPNWTIQNDPQLTVPKQILEQLFEIEKERMMQANLTRMRAANQREAEKKLIAKSKKDKAFNENVKTRKEIDHERNLRRRSGQK